MLEYLLSLLLDFLDVILIIIYLPICYLIGYQIRSRHPINPIYRKWFIKGLSAKLLGGLAFALVYTFYYEYGGDTRSYYRDTLIVIDAFWEGPKVLWEVLHRSLQNVDTASLDFSLRTKFKDPREYFVVNITSIFTLLGLRSYFSATLLVALFTYWGVWHFFLLMVSKFPKLEKQMAFAILFVPSVFFWGSGISKDSFIFCGVGLILYHIDIIFSGRFWNIKSLILIALASYIMFTVKAYVLISLAPAIVLWRSLYLRDKIKSNFIRAAALPVVAAVSLLSIVYTLDFLSEYNKKYSVDSFVNTAQSMQGWHYVEGENTSDKHGRGSSYTLGDYDADSWQGLLKIFPAAVNVTFFRPYFWEINGAAMLAQAIESFLLLLFTIVTLFRVGPLRIYRYISNDSLLLMCVIFAIFFGFAVGFSSYNFGALSRYKIPCVPFYVASLFIIRHRYLESKTLKREQFHEVRAKRRKMTSKVPQYA